MLFALSLSLSSLDCLYELYYISERGSSRNQILAHLCIHIFIFTSKSFQNSHKPAVVVFLVTFELARNMLNYYLDLRKLL